MRLFRRRKSEPEPAQRERTIRVRPEGAALARGWALLLQQAPDDVDTDDLAACAAWLDQDGHLPQEVDREQARMLLELVLAGGELTVVVPAEAS